MQLLSEELVTPAQFTKECPGRPSLRTVWRWLRQGCRGVRLESVLIGGQRFTSIEAGLRFIEATTAKADGSKTGAVARVARERQSSLERAERELDESGVK